MIRVDPSPIYFYFFYSIRVGPSRSELIRPGLAVGVDPVRLLYLPLVNYMPTIRQLKNSKFIVPDFLRTQNMVRVIEGKIIWIVRVIEGSSYRG